MNRVYEFWNSFPKNIMGKTVIFLHELGTEIKNMNKGKYAMGIQSYLHLLLNFILLPISCQPLIFSRPRPLSHYTSSISFINFIVSQLSHKIWRALLHAAPRVLLLLWCGGTNPKSGQTKGLGSAQCPSPPSTSTDHGLLRPPGLPSGPTPAGCFYASANSGMPGAEMAISYAARSTVVKSARLACPHGKISTAISSIGK